MKKRTLICLIGSFIAAGAAYAQNSSNKAGLSVGVEGSYNHARLLGNDSYHTREEKNWALGYRAFLAYNLNENFSLELGYFGTGNLSNKETSVLSQNAQNITSIENKINASGADLSAVYQFTEGVSGLFLKAGVTQSKIERTANTVVKNINTGVQSTLSSRALGENTTGTGYLLGLGYEMALSNNLHGRIAFTSYQRLGGQKNNKLNSFSLGLRYSF